MIQTTLAALLLIATAGVAPAAEAAAGGDGAEPAYSRRLTILHTSDLHGAVLPFDYTRNEGTDHSMAQLATLVAQIRSEEQHPVLLLDSGDTIQGSPLELFVNVRWGRTSPTVAAMNLMGYQAMAVGNHEFNFGLEVLRRAERAADFPFLSANTINEKNGRPAFPPYSIVELGELKVAVLGLTTPKVPDFETPEHYRGLRFEDMHEAARRWVEVLRNEHGCHLVVVLAHCGFEYDPETGADQHTSDENFAWRLARVPGIDVLLTGHTHTAMNPQKLGGAIVSQPQSYARYLTRIDLELELAAEKGWQVAGWKGENISTRGVQPDPLILEAFAEPQQQVIEALDATLTHTTGELSVARCRLEDCAALDLIHTVQLDATGADLSLAAILSDRTPDLAVGPLNWKWIYALYVYPNTPLTVRVSGQQVKDILEHSARYYDGLDCAAGGACTVRTDPLIRHYNVDSMAGVTYRIDPTRAEGDRVRDLRRHGRALDLHELFTLACNNYRAAGGGSFPHLAEAEVVWTSSTEISELIGAYLQRFDSWQPTTDSNWCIAPEIGGEKTLSEPQ